MHIYGIQRASLVAQMVKNLPSMQENWLWSLGQEDPLEKGMATHSGFLAWKNPMDRGAWRATVHGFAKSWTWLNGFSTSWNLERWCWRTYLQGTDGDADIENRSEVTIGEGEGGTGWESSTGTYTLLYVKQSAGGTCCLKQGAQPSTLWPPRGVG